jgi:hypothetical protein
MVDVKWARSHVSSRHRGKFHVAVGEGIYMHALCVQSLSLTPGYVSEAHLKRLDKDRLCSKCLRKLEDER